MPKSLRVLLVGGAILAAAAPRLASAQTTGSALPQKSSGAPSGSAWTLSTDGFVGTYITVNQAGPVTFTINAGGVASNGVAPDMTLSIADSNQSFAVTSTSQSAYTYTTPSLPAGTYFVRTQLDNHKTELVNNVATSLNTTLTVGSLGVSSNATLLTTNTDANAIAAANTYIDNFRKGNATVTLSGAAPGTQVQVTLQNNAFNLGTYVSGTSNSASDNYLAANPAVGTNAYYFQKFIGGQTSGTNATSTGDRFNAIEPSNAGKWQSNESFFNGNSTGVTMGPVDQMMAYAQAHDLSARQHNIIWGSQQPTQIKTWVTDAASGSATAAQSRISLQNAITNRINYYIKGANSVNGNARATAFQQLDVLNEALQTGPYFNALGGYSGVAAVYKQVQDAVKTVAGASTLLYTNEYNVLQNSPLTVTPSNTFGGQGAAAGSDAYANWYRNEVEGINNAAISAGATGNVVTGIGAQYYPTSGTRGPTVLQSALQNLSVEGLPISIPEFGAQLSLRSQNVAGGAVPQIVDDTIRMAMGTPQVNSLLVWGWYDDGTASTNNFGGGSVFVNNGWVNADGSWNLTAAGTRFEYLFGRGLDTTAPGNVNGVNPDPLATNLTTTVGADGTIHFNGFYGDYTVTVNGQTYDLSFDKNGNSQFTIAVPEPGSAALAGLACLLLGRRGARRRKVKAV